jgi:hypothetical protein
MVRLAIQIRVANRGELELLPKSLDAKRHDFFPGRHPLPEKGSGEVRASPERVPHWPPS